MLKEVKLYTNKKSGEVITEREFKRLDKTEKKDYKPQTGTNHVNYRN